MGLRRAPRVLASGVGVLVITASWAAQPAVALAVPPTAAAAAGGQGIGEDQPTADQVRAARDRAAALHRSVDRQATTLTQARAAMRAAAADSALALETSSEAAAVRNDAEREAAHLDDAVSHAQQAVDDARAGLGQWARAAYMDGGTLGTSPGLYTVLAGGSTDDVATARTWLARAGRSRLDIATQLRGALAARQAAGDRAARAVELAEAAAAQAEAAAAARDAVLAAQRARLVDLESLLAGTRDAAATADLTAARLALTRDGRAQVAAGSIGLPGNGGSSLSGPVGDCPGADTSPYANGRIPLSALCPVWGAPGALLRADAAYAMSRMSQAYAAASGHPICVTDAYRSYDEQVAVRARRGAWAAVPGRSNHGWGTAADLCGGVENVDSAAHAWMLLNAPLFGWFHPAWAEPDGSLPEPWHWEYGGS